MVEIVRCPNCLAPLRLDVGPVVQCRYCDAQVRLDAPQAIATKGVASGKRLAKAIGFATPAMTIPFLEANAPLPIYRTETLSTQSDDQEALNVNLVEGTSPIVSLKFPIQKRGPRGVPKIALTVRVSASGAMSLTVAEPGTSNIFDRDGFSVSVAT
jgi:hypothetical protein